MDNGVPVPIAVPEGMTEDQAATMFARAYNAKKDFYHSLYPAPEGGGLPAPSELEQSVARPQVAAAQPLPDHTPIVKPSTMGLSMSDLPGLAKAYLSGIPGALGSAFSGSSITPQGLAGDAAMTQFGGPSSGKLLRALFAQLGGERAPATPAEGFAKSAGEGTTLGVLTGGAGTLGGLVKEGATGALSGITGRAGANVGGPILGVLAGGLPYGARAVANAVSPKNAINALAREDLAATPQAHLDYATELEKVADSVSAPSMAWQHFPPNSPIRQAGVAAATMPGRKPIQKKLAELQGGDYDFDETTGKPYPIQPHSAADIASITQADNPYSAAYANNLRETDVLRGRGPKEMQSAGGHEVQNIALGLHLADVVAPGLAAPLKTVAGSAHGLQAMGAVRRFMGGEGAVNDLYTQPTLDAYRDVANYRPRVKALQQALQAYIVPKLNTAQDEGVQQ
jgi:hypothetical protein